MVESTNQAAECLCGRLENRPHCPNCGSYQTYGYAKRVSVIRAGGKEAKLKTFRCLLCSEIFNDDDWQLRCHAPALRQRGRPQKLAVRVNSMEERARLLEDFRELRMLKDLP